MTQSRKILAITLIFLAVAGIFALFAPWKIWAERRLVAMLAAQGISPVQLSISHLGLRGITLENLAVGDENPLVLRNITLNYSPRELWEGRLRDVTLSGLELQAAQGGEGWFVSGLQSLGGKREGGKSFHLPVSAAEMNFLPFQSLAVEKSLLKAKAAEWSAQGEFTVKAEKSPVPALEASSPGITLRLADGREIRTQAAFLAAALKEDKKQWDGKWSIRQIALPELPLPLPVLNAEGTLTATSGHITAGGWAMSADGAYRADFRLEYPLNGKAPRLTLSRAQFPWHGGEISARNVSVPLTGKSAISADVTVSRVSIDAVLQSVTGSRVAATGAVSGALPLRISPDGTVELREAELRADAPGTLSLSADAIPGGGEQVSLVRDVLRNFHYNTLTLSLSGDTKKGISAQLRLEGSNPDVYQGQAVKLNVNLTGDVLQLIRQSMELSDPEKLLKQQEKR